MPASLILATTEEAAWKRLQDLSVCARLAGLDLLALIILMIVLQTPVVMEELVKI